MRYMHWDHAQLKRCKMSLYRAIVAEIVAEQRRARQQSRKRR